MTDSRDDRYQDIIKRIAARPPFGQKTRRAARQTPHDRALDSLNAYDSLAELARGEYARVLCHGPKHIHGRAWSAIVTWHHRKSYHGYQTLTLRGIWAHYRAGEITVSVGARDLPYRAPIYDPSVFRVAIGKGFKLYYNDDGGPPQAANETFYTARFDENERLPQREALEEIVQAWRRELEAG